jgi:uncharacterized protein YqfB (UPF0267 family)
MFNVIGVTPIGKVTFFESIEKELLSRRKTSKIVANHENSRDKTRFSLHAKPF